MNLRTFFARNDTFPDLPAWQHAIQQEVARYTMTGNARIHALTGAVEYLVEAGIPGAFVECGVWRGGSMMATALALKHCGVTDRDLYLFDTFKGMTQPTSADVDFKGASALATIQKYFSRSDRAGWCEASMDEVGSNMRGTGYPLERIHLVQGDVEATIPAAAPDRIALLRLDTDWHASTKHEFEHLYDRVASGGVVIIDDYGHWQGARQATDEFLARRNIKCLLHRVDYTARMFVKPD